LGRLKNDINNSSKVEPLKCTMSGAACYHIRRWVRSFTEQELEYFALRMPTEKWRKLADIVHYIKKKAF
jgi:hypothetical protein